jgi:hypothetical protein
MATRPLVQTAPRSVEATSQTRPGAEWSLRGLRNHVDDLFAACATRALHLALSACSGAQGSSHRLLEPVDAP